MLWFACLLVSELHGQAFGTPSKWQATLAKWSTYPELPVQGRITCQLRSSITCMLLRKAFLVPAYAEADSGTADVQTLMSVGERAVRTMPVQHEPNIAE